MGILSKVFHRDTLVLKDEAKKNKDNSDQKPFLENEETDQIKKNEDMSPFLTDDNHELQE